MSALRSGGGPRAGAVLVLALAGHPGRAAAAVPDDLGLGADPLVATAAKPASNPHGSLACSRCHAGTEQSYPEARRAGTPMPLVAEAGGSVGLCRECHPDAHGFHPVDFPVKRLADAIARAGVFPLDTPYEGYDKLTCTSCHDVHFPGTANSLLRGFPFDEPVASAPFRTRLDFCRACHGAEEIARLSGHRAAPGDTGCGLCHGLPDAAGTPGPLKRTLNSICAFCHPPAAAGVAHFAPYNPFPGQPAPAAGRWTCASCHVHHRGGAASPGFTAQFLAAVAKSTRVSPHRSARFCLGCHPETPPPPGTPGARAPLVEPDVTRLCQGCHDREGGLRMDHPLKAPTKEVPAPADWPLRADGTLGCQSCHLAGHAPRDPANPRFLRGGPYRQRNEPCRRCHREEPVRRNIHQEIADSRGCERCHLPESPEPGAAFEPGALRAEPTLLCLLCHVVAPHPASAEHTGRPRAGGGITVDQRRAPLTLGKITCFTCHDTHEGSAEEKFLRAAGPTALCGACHPH
jgi:predicted CXXCH cytochrome family protein